MSLCEHISIVTLDHQSQLAGHMFYLFFTTCSLTDGEIQRLANSRAEREAFVKSTVIFAVTWVLGVLVFVFLPYVDYRFTGYFSTGFVVSFFVAFIAGLVTSWLVKGSAYEKSYT